MNASTSEVSHSAIRPDAWLLDPAVMFLNHGSFGACPKPILERQREIRLAMDREPVEFLVRKLTPLLDESRTSLAELIGADPADLVFVHNVTAGVNSVLRSLVFRPGDEILVTTHDYNACRNVARYVAERSGAVVVVVDVPLPINSPRQVVDAVLERVTAQTRLVMLDHITSPTALVFPVEDLVRELNDRGIDTLVDGSHAPGMVPLNLKRLGAAYYTGNCHKWLCAPKGAGFLYVRRDRQAGIQPPIISHGWNRPRRGYSPFQDVFDWPGTFDPSAWVCVGEAIRFVRGLLPGGLPSLMKRNHDLAILAQKILCERLGVVPVGIESMLGSMAAVELPDVPPAPSPSGVQTGLSCQIECPVAPGDAECPLHNRLIDEFGIEVPVYYWPAPPRTILRVSAQAYNDRAQYERLAEVLGGMTKLE
jgi:isopenicillin-N epimerase